VQSLVDKSATLRAIADAIEAAVDAGFDPASVACPKCGGGSVTFNAKGWRRFCTEHGWNAEGRFDEPPASN
jgi:hypothetical protein